MNLLTFRKIEKLLWGCVLLWGITFLVSHLYSDEEPIKKPLSVAQVGKTNFSFKTQSSVSYQLRLTFDKVKDNGVLVCDTMPSPSCRELFKNLSVNWKLTSNTQNISSGELTNIDTTSISGNRIGVFLDVFQGNPGTEMNLEVHNLGADKNVELLSPEIEIFLTPVALVNGAIDMLLMLIVGVILVFVALVYSCGIRLKKLRYKT